MKSPVVPAEVWEDAPSILPRVIKVFQNLKILGTKQYTNLLNLTMNWGWAK
jgi:hypothetical protein